LVSSVEGLEVGAVASSGEEALLALADRFYDLVLLDVHMPGIGGVETARRIRAQHPEAVVLLTSVDDDGQARIDTEHLQAHYIGKGDLGPDRLEQFCNEVLGDPPATRVPGAKTRSS
jgi:DNA-binding NarL/FixJ family response regulator